MQTSDMNKLAMPDQTWDEREADRVAQLKKNGLSRSEVARVVQGDESSKAGGELL